MPTASRLACILLAATLAASCGGSKSPTSPSTPQTPSATPTKIIGISGSLNFGDVLVGSSRDATFTISNSGNTVLTVTRMTVTGGLASQTTATWTNGQIAPGASQPVTVRFSPTAAGSYSGTVSVTADHTGGSNTIGISGTAISATPFSGVWIGSYVVERCDGTGSVQDIFCSANRGLYPVGSVLPISMSLTQSGSSITGIVAFGQVTGAVTGSVDSAGVLTLRGTATSGALNIAITTWVTRVVGSTMEGAVAYNATSGAAPGVATVTTRLSGVTKR